MKKLISIILVVAMLACAVPFSASAATLNNFTKKYTYTSGQYSDVPKGCWYEDSVKAAHELGLMNGSTPSRFNATGNVTIAETVTVAARIHKIYNEGNDTFAVSSPWWKTYESYALSNGIITANISNPSTHATREVYASIISKALPTSELEAINTVDDNAIPDVPAGGTYSDSIYMLYRAGILGGNDNKGTFAPKSPIRRNAVSAIVTRMADEDERLDVVLYGNVPEEDIKQLKFDLLFAIGDLSENYNYYWGGNRMKEYIVFSDSAYKEYLNKPSVLNLSTYIDRVSHITQSSAGMSHELNKALVTSSKHSSLDFVTDLITENIITADSITETTKDIRDKKDTSPFPKNDLDSKANDIEKNFLKIDSILSFIK